MLAMHRDVAEFVEARLRTALAEARDVMGRHRSELDALATAVADRETLTGEEAALVVADVSAQIAQQVLARARRGRLETDRG